MPGAANVMLDVSHDWIVIFFTNLGLEVADIDSTVREVVTLTKGCSG